MIMQPQAEGLHISDIMRKVHFNYRKNNPEGLIQRAILEYMQYHGIMAWRQNSGKLVIGDKDHKRFVQLGRAGMPDIIGVIGPRFKDGSMKGMMMAIEVKTVGNKPTELQEMTMQELRDHGAIVNVIHSVDELESWFAAI